MSNTKSKTNIYLIYVALNAKHNSANISISNTMELFSTKLFNFKYNGSSE